MGQHMPIVYQFDHALQVLEVRAFGHVTIYERAQFVETVTTDQSLPVKIPILIDVTGISNPPAIDDVPKMARLLERLATHFKSRVTYFVTQVGIVTPYMLASAQVDDQLACTGAFTNCDEAIEWLHAGNSCHNAW